MTENEEEPYIDVSECLFRVTENDEDIWIGADYKHAFFLRDINPQARKVFVEAKIDATIDAAANLIMNNQLESDE